MSDTASIVSIIGTVMLGVLLASQLPAMYHVIRATKSVEHLSVGPTVGQGGNFLSWVIYGIVAKEMAVLRVNAIGLGFSFVFLTFFLCYAKGAQFRSMVRSLIIGAIVLSAVYAGIIVPQSISHDTKVSILGGLAVAFNVVMYAAPISQLLMAVRCMDPAVIPVLVTLAGLGLSAVWCAYGLLTSNWFVAGPNVAGIILSLIQLGVAVYVILRVRADPSLTKPMGHREDSDKSSLLEKGAATMATGNALAYSALPAGTDDSGVRRH